MKQAFTKILIPLVCVVLMFSMSACSKPEDKVIGSWYDTNMNELYFTEDGTYTFSDEGGTYSVDGDRVVLIDGFGDAENFNIVDDGNITYLEGIDSSYVFYPYDYAYDLYSQEIRKEEEERVSTVDSIREYFPGTWVGDGSNCLNDYVLEIYDDGTFKIISDDAYYENTSNAGLTGTWSFDEDWNDQLYYFKTAYQYPDDDRTYNTEEEFYIPYWEGVDLSNIRITIAGVRLYKQN